MKNYIKSLLLFAIISFFSNNNTYACHAVALLNVNQQILGPNSIQVTATSDPATCGCAPETYWLDIEVRCTGEAFDGAPFSPHFYGPLNSYPYFQSADMLKPNCTAVDYSYTTIPFAGLCPGMTYQYRMRENHNGTVGPWCATQTFTVPGTTLPLIVNATATQTTICAGACVDLSSTIIQGCGLADTYLWSTGATTANVTNVCPAVTTTYSVTVTEACSGFTDNASVTVNVVPPPVNGTAVVSPTTFCNTAAPSLSITGQAGTIQWQSAPSSGGPWTNIAGATTTPYNSSAISNTTCYRAEITGCGTSGSTILYSNVVCVTKVIPTPPNMSSTNESCSGVNDGTATATAVGMAAPITYSWNTTPTQNTATATGLAPGTYTVTVSDLNGCTETNTVTIVAGPLVVAGFTPPINQCLTGNSYTFNNTGTTGVTYAWDFGNGSGTSTQENPTYTYPAAGTYTVTQTVSSGACSDVATATVVVYDMPLPVATNTPVLCNGDATGTVTITTPIPNGSSPYTYSWNSTPVQTSNPASGLVAGTYTATVTDANGCIGTATTTITEPLALTATVSNVPPACAGGSDGTAIANGVDGSGPYTYSWNTSPIQNTQTATGLTAGTYTATVTDANSCTFTISTTLVDPVAIVLNPSMTQANCGQPDGSATVVVTSGGSGNFSYSWNTTPVQNTQTASNILAGNYTVTVTDNTTGCVQTATIAVTTTAGITATATLINDALCNGSSDGQASAAPTGGIGPYT